MTLSQPTGTSGRERQLGLHSLRGPALLTAALLCVWLGLVSAQPALAPVEAAEEAGVQASESPSDVKSPAPDQPSGETAASPTETTTKAACCPPCRGVRSCRRGCVLPRLLRRCRPRRCCCVVVPHREDGPQKTDAPAKSDPYAWKSLFDGKTLEGWKAPEFGGEGKVYVEDGKIVMEMGEMMTGVKYTGEVPRDNFELEYEGIRLEGVDFFATVTFPVGKDEASLVTGGWGGTVVGISCIDYYDAVDNLTTTFREFKDKQWYKFRVRVTPAKIEAWIDDEQVVDQERKDRKIGIRDECSPCRPLGFATYTTTGAVRNVRLRQLKPSAGSEQPAQGQPASQQ